LILFFSYGHIYHLAKQIESVGEIWGRQRFLFPLFFAAGGLGSFLILTIKETSSCFSWWT